MLIFFLVSGASLWLIAGECLLPSSLVPKRDAPVRGLRRMESVPVMEGSADTVAATARLVLEIFIYMNPGPGARSGQRLGLRDPTRRLGY